MFGGGSLSPSAGAKLASAGVNMLTVYGSTENGGVAYSLDKRDPLLEIYAHPGIQWLKPSPHCNPRWAPQGDGTYELQLLVSSLSLTHPNY